MSDKTGGPMDGGPAFPCDPNSIKNVGEWQRLQQGMSFRDYLAAKAMQAIIQAAAIKQANPSWEDVSIKSYKQADAMIAKRNET